MAITGARNPSVAAATKYGSRDKLALVAFNIETGVFGETLFSHPDHDIDLVRYDPQRARVTGLQYTDDLPRTWHLDEADRGMQARLSKAIPGAETVIESTSDDGARMIVKAVYSDHPPQWFLFDRNAKTLDLIGSTYPALDGKRIARKEKFDYTAADGVRIPGYLTVPAGATKRAMPLIVLPHGGPEGRDDMAFDWWAFFYAARGYLVYQPNFRGSDGYGYEFRSAGFGEWGRKMQDDVTEGVRKLIADGVVDKDRVCIVGASYGGYAALAGATLTPDLYACAVSVNGVSDLLAMLGEDSRGGGVSLDYWETRIGSRFRDAKQIEAVSPARIAGQAGAPVLLIHGRDDTVVPFSQSTRMRDALNRAGKPVEFVELQGEDHWLSRGETRTAMLAASVAFIDRQIGE